MSLLLNEGITIKREQAGGDYVDGHYVPAPDESPALTGLANIQPLGGKELLQLPESDRIRHPVRIYTDVALQNKDIVVRDLNSDEFEVQNVANWAVFGALQHYKAIGFLIDAQ
jgi:hypothetical protein